MTDHMLNHANGHMINYWINSQAESTVHTARIGIIDNVCFQVLSSNFTEVDFTFYTF